MFPIAQPCVKSIPSILKIEIVYIGIVMNFTHLRAFHAVASERSFTRAAQVLRLTQPTVSAHVKALESAYGVRLLDRRNGKVVANEIGTEVLRLCRQIFGAEDELESVLKQNRQLQNGRLKVGADGPRHIVPVLEEFIRLHPGVTVTLSTGNAKQVLERLRDYETDAAIVALAKPEEPGLHLVPFCAYSLIAFVPRKHPWASRRTISPRDFHGQRVVVREATSMTRQLLNRALQRAQARPASLIEIDNREASREAVTCGIGVGVMSAVEFPSPDKRCVPLRIAAPDLELTEYVACLEQRRNIGVVREFFRVAAYCAATIRATMERHGLNWHGEQRLA